MRGFLNIDKPAGITSFEVVRAIRRASGVRRVGHGGTLDPLATGVLPVAVGDATRLIEALTDARKGYLAEITMGAETDTDDAHGEVTTRGEPAAVAALTSQGIEDALNAFVGEHNQLPPAYSAIKREGVPAYRAARRGEPLELAPRPVVAYALRLIKHDGALCTVKVACGKGYYVRALARDLGRALGVGAHVSALRRTRVGPFHIERATPLAAAVARLEARDELDALLHAPDAVLTAWPAIILDGDEVTRIRQGREVAPPSRRPAAPGARTRAYGPEGHLESIAIPTASGSWRPIRVFPPDIAMDS